MRLKYALTLVLLLLFAVPVLAYNENHPYTILTQTQIDRAKVAIATNTPPYIKDAYDAAYGYAVSVQNDAPKSQPSSWWTAGYLSALTESEKMISFAIVYAITEDPAWATRTRNYVMNFVNSWSGGMLAPLAFEINVLWAYDLTYSSGVYSAADRTAFWSYVTSMYNGGSVCASRDGDRLENMDWVECGLEGLAALMLGDSAKIARARDNGFKYEIDNTNYDGGNVGAAPDFTIRGCDGLDYHHQSSIGLWVPAIAAHNLGESGWHDYTNGSRSLETTADWFAGGPNACDSSACGGSPPCDDWIPYIYGNLRTGNCINNSAGQNTGDYADYLQEKECTDKRYVLEAAQWMYGAKSSYTNVLNDTSGGKIGRGQLYGYHTFMWLPAFMNAPAVGQSSPECADGLDNDGDGLIDNADSDCYGGSDPAEDPCSDGSDYCETVCANPDVVRCYGFEDQADITTGNPQGTTNCAPGSCPEPISRMYDPSGGVGNCTLQGSTACWDLDQGQSANGDSALRFQIPSQSGASTGSFRMNFQDDYSLRVGAGEELYVQYRYRLSPEMLRAFRNSDGYKASIIGGGDWAGGPPQNSCTDLETVVQTSNNYLGPYMYHACGYFNRLEWYDQATCGNVRNQDVINDSPPTYCCYGDFSGCWDWSANEWMTVQVHIRVGSWNTPGSSRIRLWMAREGQPSVMVFDSDISGTASSFAGNINNEDPANHKFGKIWLLAYNTNKDPSEVHPTGYVWYDDLIVSRTRIPDPGGTSTGNPPPAPGGTVNID